MDVMECMLALTLEDLEETVGAEVGFFVVGAVVGFFVVGSIADHTRMRNGAKVKANMHHKHLPTIIMAAIIP